MKIGGPGMLALATVVLLNAPAEAKKCKGDAIKVGPVCVDKYEASVWEIAPANASLIKNVQKGKIQAPADLAGATQRGASSDDYGAGCPDTANGCKDFYAVSVAGVAPSANLTWFQAAAACRNSGKRLATNLEWQMAALGTPDPGTDDGTSDCNVLGLAPVSTGSRSLCASDTGAFDMVGNVAEWVADWGDRSTVGCTDWPGTYGSDASCVGGDGSSTMPGALVRGGIVGEGTHAGVFAARADLLPSTVSDGVGFRCAREL